MVTLGVDAHKFTHTAVAVDGNGGELATKTVDATSAGHLELGKWASQWPERKFAVEDCRHLSRRREVDVVTSGERVVRVPTRLMAGLRRSGRKRGKSDPIDAAAVARAALREPSLPLATLDGPDRDVRLLMDYRDDLVGERTRMENRLLWDLHELEPVLRFPARSFRSVCQRRTMAAALRRHPGLLADIARKLLETILHLSARIERLDQEVNDRIVTLAPHLLALRGCGPLTAAKLISEVAGIGRFRSRAAFAAYNCTAPIPVWSSNKTRFRLNRGGTRQINAALYRIALTQIRRDGPGYPYLKRRLAEGRTKPEALRALKRHLSDEVYRRLLLDSHEHHDPDLRATGAA
ncbi:MAG: IS110 family transposase [Candidatus Dormibacteria bacterium]